MKFDKLQYLRSTAEISTVFRIATFIQLAVFLTGLDCFALSNWQNGFPKWFHQRKAPHHTISIDFDPQNQLNTSFRIAIRESRLENAKKFLLQGAEINSSSPEGETSLMYASRNCSDKAVKFLLNRGANINLRDKYGRTALIYAARESCVKVVRLLASSPFIKVHFKDSMRKTALDYAYKSSVLEVAGPAEAIIRILQRS
jgi:ankyrin repeat protein